MADLKKFRAVQVGHAAVGANALGALAVGALAIGAVAIGALAIGKLKISRTEMKSAWIDDLTIGTVRVRELTVTDTLRTPA
jgi:hypothetical protein